MCIYNYIYNLYLLKTYASVVWWDGALVRGLLWFSIVFDPSDGQHLDD